MEALRILHTQFEMSLRARVFGEYRGLFRASKKRFAGDPVTLGKAMVEIRKHFRDNSSETDEKEIKEMIDVAVNAKEYLLENVVSADMNQSTGNYRMNIDESHVKYDK